VPHPVVAIAIDALPPERLDSWMASGRLPVLKAIRQQGAYGRLGKSRFHLHESSWSAFLQGCNAERPGAWGHYEFRPDCYEVRELPAYDTSSREPFYALLSGRRVAVFDVPLTHPVVSVNGVQILGWGVEENQFQGVSLPEGLFADLVRRYGKHPFFYGATTRTIGSAGDAAIQTMRVPSSYDMDALCAAKQQIMQAIRQRTGIVRELLQRHPCDFLLAVSAELHVAEHLYWHLGMPHPLREKLRTKQVDHDWLGEIAGATDASLGEILADVPEDAFLVLFSVSGMTSNYTDLPTCLFLPEFLFRLQWGEAALAAGESGRPPDPPATHYRRHWKDEVWDLRTPRGDALLESPAVQERRNDPLDWNPLNWYRLLWPQMHAFALPSFSHGLIRINVRGRDGRGTVAPEDYAGVCSRLTDALMRLTDARSGRPLVREIRRTRAAADDAMHAAPADLLVLWQEGPTDVVDSPDIGRIGPVPYFRTGGHAPDGFCVLRGPGIGAGSRLPEQAQVADLTASLLTLMGHDVPAYMDGRPWWPIR
jgi:predicted AlkP superfamily phosphohydrolase/phosphomutase